MPALCIIGWSVLCMKWNLNVAEFTDTIAQTRVTAKNNGPVWHISFD